MRASMAALAAWLLLTAPASAETVQELLDRVGTNSAMVLQAESRLAVERGISRQHGILRKDELGGQPDPLPQLPFSMHPVPSSPNRVEEATAQWWKERAAEHTLEDERILAQSRFLGVLGEMKFAELRAEQYRALHAELSALLEEENHPQLAEWTAVFRAEVLVLELAVTQSTAAAVHAASRARLHLRQEPFAPSDVEDDVRTIMTPRVVPEQPTRDRNFQRQILEATVEETRARHRMQLAERYPATNSKFVDAAQLPMDDGVLSPNPNVNYHYGRLAELEGRIAFADIQLVAWHQWFRGELATQAMKRNEAGSVRDFLSANAPEQWKTAFHRARVRVLRDGDTTALPLLAETYRRWRESVEASIAAEEEVFECSLREWTLEQGGSPGFSKNVFAQPIYFQRH